MKGRNKIIISTLIMIFIILLSIAGYFIYKKKRVMQTRLKNSL